MKLYTVENGKVEAGIRVLANDMFNGSMVLLGDRRQTYAKVRIHPDVHVARQRIACAGFRIRPDYVKESTRQENEVLLKKPGDYGDQFLPIELVPASASDTRIMVRINTRWKWPIDTMGQWAFMEPSKNGWNVWHFAQQERVLVEVENRYASLCGTYGIPIGGWSDALVLMEAGEVIRIYLEWSGMVHPLALVCGKREPLIYRWDAFMQCVNADTSPPDPSHNHD